MNCTKKIQYGKLNIFQLANLNFRLELTLLATMNNKASILTIATFILGLFCCKSSNFDPTTLVQTGLDSIRNSRYGFPESRELILVKDDYSAHLTGLLYGKTKLVLKAVPKQMIKYYYTNGDDTTKTYFTVYYEKLKRDQLFVSIEIDHNCLFKFYFKPQENIWKMNSYTVTIH